MALCKDSWGDIQVLGSATQDQEKAEGETEMSQVGSKPAGDLPYFQGVQAYKNSLRHIRITKWRGQDSLIYYHHMDGAWFNRGRKAFP